MKKALFSVVFLAAGLVLLSCTQVLQPQGTRSTNTGSVASSAAAFEDEVLVHVNKYRKSKGLAPLRMHDAIVEESRKHSYNMANNIVPFSHDGFNTRSKNLASRIPGMRSVAENVAYGQMSAREVVEDWIKSPGHRKNIEGNYTQTGIGIATSKKGVLYYTQMFVR